MSIYTRHNGVWHRIQPTPAPTFSLPEVTTEGEVLTTTTDSYDWAPLAAYTKEESDAKYATTQYVDENAVVGDPGLVHLIRVNDTINSTTPLEIKNIFSANYANYLIKIDHIADTQDTHVSMRLMSGDTVIDGDTLYQWTRTTEGFDATVNRVGSQAGGGQAQWGMVANGENGQHRHSDIELHWPYVDGHYPTMSMHGTSSVAGLFRMSGYLADSSILDGVHLFMTQVGPSIQVWVNIYGYKDVA